MKNAVVVNNGNSNVFFQFQFPKFAVVGRRTTVRQEIDDALTQYTI